MRLIFSRMNCAWVFVFGRDCSPIRLHNNELFHNSRALAVQAAKALGLKVNKKGEVSCA